MEGKCQISEVSYNFTATLPLPNKTNFWMTECEWEKVGL